MDYYHSDLFYQRLVPQHYKLAHSLAPVLSDITQNEFTKILSPLLTQNNDLYMASLDVGALFTNIL